MKPTDPRTYRHALIESVKNYAEASGYSIRDVARQFIEKPSTSELAKRILHELIAEIDAHDRFSLDLGRIAESITLLMMTGGASTTTSARQQGKTLTIKTIEEAMAKLPKPTEDELAREKRLKEQGIVARPCPLHRGAIEVILDIPTRPTENPLILSARERAKGKPETYLDELMASLKTAPKSLSDVLSQTWLDRCEELVHELAMFKNSIAVVNRLKHDLPTRRELGPLRFTMEGGR